MGIYVRARLIDVRSSRDGINVALGSSLKSAKAVSFRHLIELFGENLFPYLVSPAQHTYRSGSIVRVRQAGARLGKRAASVVAKPKPTKYDVILTQLNLRQRDGPAPCYDVKYDSGYTQRGMQRSMIAAPAPGPDGGKQEAASKTTDGAAAGTLAEGTKTHARCVHVEQTYMGLCL